MSYHERDFGLRIVSGKIATGHELPAIAGDRFVHADGMTSRGAIVRSLHYVADKHAVVIRGHDDVRVGLNAADAEMFAVRLLRDLGYKVSIEGDSGSAL